MYRTALRLAAAVSLTALAAPALAQGTARTSLTDLVNQVNIPYETFTLPNGLRVIVHTDRKAPVVAVSVWYHIGSKNEPAGKTGFAHLFEHMMFYGSENAPGAFFGRLEEIGATDWNGTTWFDRTNYFQTVPTGALDRMLFLESDRMGHLLGAVTQEKLDNQRGVVQNEKRMGENEPGGLVEYAELAALLPVGHPYRHSTIGSMADLNSASLEDVKNWFREHYGPNNAVLVLAGDIDLATAKQKVTRYFGDIKRGPDTPRPAVAIPTLPAPVEKVMFDRVAQTRVQREWTAPGAVDQESNLLDLALDIIGGLGSSRLNDALVRNEKIAVGVSAGLQVQENLSFAEISARVKPGGDAAQVGRRVDEIVAEFLKNGPTEDEVRRAATTTLANRVKGLEQVGGFGGKAVALAEGAVYSNDPAEYKKDLQTIAAATPASVLAAARKWLARPAFRLTLAPGERSAADQALAGNDTAAVEAPAVKNQVAANTPAPTRPQPAVGQLAALQFPAVERTTLSNGMKVVFARRSTVPVVRVAAAFDAGSAADDRAKLGTHALMVSLLEEGTTTRSSAQIAQEEERLGATVSASGGLDSTSVSVAALKANLAPSLDLLADIVRNPAFAPGEVERLRTAQLARIASEMTQPQGIALRTLPPLIYGTQHPYGIPLTGSGSPEGVRAATRDDLVAFHAKWIRPDNGTLYVVGDTTLGEMKPLLESRFGSWRAPAVPKGVKAFTAPVPTPQPRILLIDKPQSPQSMIIAGAVTPVKGTEDPIALNIANDVIGGSSTSRLITNLRETKGWAYYAGTSLQTTKDRMPLLVIAPVQTDKTGPAITEARNDLTAWLSTKGTTADEAGRAIRNSVLSLPGSFETGSDLLGALIRNDQYGRPDNYYATLAGRYQALTPAALDQAARGVFDPAKLTWVVVGDAAKVKPQLDSIGLPVEVVGASPAAPATPAAAPRPTE
ncbi:Predicted Zn-dependent peptidase [Sphingomonas guangdongensis]|uniref:Predicted Zn-dependent peptidase n=1 Tax=Sphingomonas guangdongensis TaxID=1141890 RepID=A0A285QIA8_9SPHN|nr:pitrilysin family protein [Sphingomonas guangdongensis]SOB79802.1 Predicted Zn-dependent peptidase [Sphingomonas guangdongensis]